MTLPEILASIRGLAVLVVGDICLDRWCTYDPSIAEPSRETGLPRIGVTRTELTPGAAGTIANNLAALGVEGVTVLGVIGDDGYGFELVRALSERGISAELAIKTPLMCTFTYMKLLNAGTGQEDVPRIDTVFTQPIPAEVEAHLLFNLESFFPAFQVILISDQAETRSGGVITPAIRDALCRLAAAHPEKIVWADSRKRAEHFRNVILKINRDEAEEASLRQFGRIDLAALREHTKAPWLIVTQGENGALVIGKHGEKLILARPIAKPLDVCGAGDSFSAGAATVLAVTGSAEEAVEFGNLVASITVMKPGTGTASPEEVLRAASPAR